ncbi:MAG: response regulator [Lachnospiraceae bacterium]|jgi:YesN/AraC family two-component response regulator|nr:response regulator [Lachnospiraceae bacterium]
MRRVLFVEDEAAMRTAFKKMIDWNESGFELAAITSNGVDALMYMSANPVDIVVTDLIMPVMDGLELIDKLQDFTGVILVLSNYSDFELVRKALTRGASDYILKINIDGNTLLTQLNAAAALLDAKEQVDEFDSLIPAEFDSCKKEVRDALRFIHAHYTEKIRLDDVAGAVNLNRSYLCRIFKQETQVPIFNYINNLRMQKAAALIRGGDTYMRGISEIVGIHDQFYFTKVFRKYHNMSPSEYAKSLKVKETTS